MGHLEMLAESEAVQPAERPVAGQPERPQPRGVKMVENSMGTLSPKCLWPECEHWIIYSRGLCKSCYNRLARWVKMGTTTKEKEEREGRLLPLSPGLSRAEREQAALDRRSVGLPRSEATGVAQVDWLAAHLWRGATMELYPPPDDACLGLLRYYRLNKGEFMELWAGLLKKRTAEKPAARPDEPPIPEAVAGPAKVSKADLLRRAKEDDGTNA